jgi:mono/diheme cytochrome c family protein
VNPLSGDPKAIKSGQSWYRGVCALCHGGRADGQGERGTGADLRKFNLGFKGYVEVVKKGRQVQGRIQGMPGWAGVLDDKTIYEIGAYLETLAMEGANWKEGVKR